MNRTDDLSPVEYIQDGKLTRRTFIKGAGWVTVTTALGLSAFGCAKKEDAATDVEAPQADEILIKHSVCSVNCTSRCHLEAQVKNGRIFAVTPGAMPGRDDYANACLRSMSLAERMQNEEVRVMYPMRRTGERGSGEFERISWEDAISDISAKLKETIDKFGAKAAGFYSFTGNLSKLSWEAPTRFAACLGATTFDIEGIMGDHGATMGMSLVFGQGRGAHDTRDYMNSKLVVLWGRNVADTHTSELRYIIKARENGAKVVVVDPRLCSSSAVADEWIPLKPQTDPALALGMMNVIISQDLHAKDWLVANSCAPFLINEANGSYLKDGEEYLVWDSAANAAAKAGAEGVVPALSGTFDVDGVSCRTAFDHLKDEVDKYTLEETARITGLSQEMIEAFALEYINAQPAGIRMGQGMQRVWNSFSPFRTVATLAAVAGYIGIEGGGASHAGGTASIRSNPDIKVEALQYGNWANTGDNKANLVTSSTLYDQVINKDPNPIDFFWIANSNFINMSPDSNRVINDVLPNISTIVCVDPYWTWTAKYSDYVLPACTHWEKWDFLDRSPWIFFCSPAIEPLGESKSDVEIMSLLAAQMGIGEFWSKTDEEWVREFPNPEHPAFEGFDIDQAIADGIWGRKDGIYDPQIVFANQTYKTKSTKFEFYTDSLVQFGEEVPCYKPMLEDPSGKLGEKYPLVFIQFHDRLNVHTQHIVAEPLKIIQDEPLLQINPVDAQTRGISEGDIVRMYNDRGFCKTRVVITEGIVPGTVAMASGWTPDYFIEGEYQELTHLTLNETEEFISQTSTAFYDVLVEVEKTEG